MSNSLITHPALHVTCTWKTPNQRVLKDVVTVTCKDEYVSSEDGLTTMVNPDTCVCLRSSLVEENGNSLNAHEPCFITLQLESQPLSAISHMVIVSEAKVIEVYGAFQEYLTTATAEFLCEIDDMTVYCAEVKLDTSSQECSLKFARTSKPFEMWLYGIQIIWEPCSGGSKAMGHDSSSFNFVTVDERLKSCLAPISKRAERCKEFIKMYGSLGASQNSVNVLPLLAMACKQKTPPSCLPLSQESEIVKDGSKAFKDPQKVLKNVNVKNAVSQNHERFSNMISASFSKGDFEEHDCTKCMQSFRTVLDESLQSMENRLLKAFDERLAKLQQFQEKQIEHAVVRIVKEISFPDTVQSVKLHEKHFQTENDVAQSYCKLYTPREQKSVTVNSSETTSKEFSVLNNDLRCADADPKDALSCSSKSPKSDGVNVFAHENNSSEHTVNDLSHLDKNCNSLSNSSSVCPPDQNRHEMKPIKVPEVNDKSKVSMLCSKVSDETRHGGGPLKDSDIEQVIMELLYGYQTSTGINSPETRLNNESALPSLQ